MVGEMTQESALWKETVDSQNIANVLRQFQGEKIEGVEIRSWVKSVRLQKERAFLHLFDGSSFSGVQVVVDFNHHPCLLYTSPSPRDGLLSRMPSSA